MSNKIKFLAVETDLHKGVEKRLLQSCKINDIDITIIGKGVKWENFMTKVKLLADYLPTIDNELVCVTDSRDVLYFGNEDEIYNTFIENFSKDSVVLNAETNIWPDKNLAPLHPEQDKKYKYLNAGCIIGNRKLLIEIYKKCIELSLDKKTTDNPKFINDDQYLLQRIFISGEYKHNFFIDYGCKLFQVVWDQNWGRSNNFDLIYGKDFIYNRLFNTYPLIFHFPGPTATDSQVWKIINGQYGNISTNKFF